MSLKPFLNIFAPDGATYHFQSALLFGKYGWSVNPLLQKVSPWAEYQLCEHAPLRDPVTLDISATGASDLWSPLQGRHTLNSTLDRQPRRFNWRKQWSLDTTVDGIEIKADYSLTLRIDGPLATVDKFSSVTTAVTRRQGVSSISVLVEAAFEITRPEGVISPEFSRLVIVPTNSLVSTLPAGWIYHPEFTVKDYLTDAEVRIKIGPVV